MVPAYYFQTRKFISLYSISGLSLEGRGQYLVLLNQSNRTGNLSLILLSSVSAQQAPLPVQLFVYNKNIPNFMTLCKVKGHWFPPPSTL